MTSGARSATGKAALAALVCWGAACGQWGVGGAGGGVPGGGDPGQMDPSRFAFRPWISANGTYSQVLGTDQVPAGARRNFYGYGGAAGLSGGKSWERTSVGLFYTANYQRYSGSSFAEGMSQVGGISVSHRMSDSVSVFATQMAGSSLGGFGYGAPAGVFGGWGLAGTGLLSDAGLFAAPLGDLAGNGLVDNELFNTRVNFYGTSGGLSYQPNLRWAFSGGGQAGYVRRKGRGLRDLNSAGAFGNASYRISRQTTVGAVYGFSTFSYPKLFGGNRAHFAGLTLSHELSPQTRLTLRFGGYRMDTTFLGSVAVDPEIAALLGVSTQIEVQKRQFYGWQGTATLSRSWRAWGASVGYTHGLNPGNGVILASRRDSVYGSAGRTIGRVSLGLYGGYYRWSGLLQRSELKSGNFGASTGLRLVKDLYLGLNGGYSFFDTTAQPRRWQRFASVHLTWSPSAAAFRF